MKLTVKIFDKEGEHCKTLENDRYQPFAGAMHEAQRMVLSYMDTAPDRIALNWSSIVVEITKEAFVK